VTGRAQVGTIAQELRSIYAYPNVQQPFFFCESADGPSHDPTNYESNHKLNALNFCFLFCIIKNVDQDFSLRRRSLSLLDNTRGGGW
jgi:hypothetical protein